MCNKNHTISSLTKIYMYTISAPARIRKGQGAEALNRALCVASQKL